MTYNPFQRGALPVGVRTIETSRKEPRARRRMKIEVWYPATKQYRGEDTNPATADRFAIAPGFPDLTQEAVRDANFDLAERLPLILYFHGGYGDRRDTAHVCTHLASRGYVVAAPDFPGDSISDLKLGEENETKISEPIDQSAADRPFQASFAISELLSDSAFAPLIDSDKIGTFGFSMGGFTALRLNSIDARPKATVALAPLYGENEFIPQIARIQKQLDVDDWNREVATFLLVGERDAFVLLPGMRELARKLRAPKRFAVLVNAGHFHWAAGGEQGHEIFRKSYLSGGIADPEVEGRGLAEAMRPFSELCPARHAEDTARALCLAHFDENLKAEVAARAFLDWNLAENFARRGIELEVETGGKTETVKA